MAARPWPLPPVSVRTLLMPDILSQLRGVVGESRVLTDTDSLHKYAVDRTSQWLPTACAVVLPGSVAEVQALVHIANRERLAVVPSGGRTGLSGGAVASNGELVVALDRLNQVLELDLVARTVRCQAGITTRELQDRVAASGLFYPVDFASAGSSQIGGNIATNAGGIRVIRYGMTRDWVLGLTVVTGNGEVLDCNRGLIKNNTGYDFRHLLIGSEGTLGIVCEATLQLLKRPADSHVLVLGVSAFAAIMDVLQVFSTRLTLSAFEFFSDLALAKVTAHRQLAAPFAGRAPFYALIEFEDVDGSGMESALALFESSVEKGWVIDGVVSQSLAQSKNLWRLREDISETLSFSKPYKNDIAVSVSRMADFIAAVDSLVAVRYPDFEVVWYGHIGDGNLHLNILKPDNLSVAAFSERCAPVSSEIGELVAQFNGSISAEHGIGLLKKDYLHYTRNEQEVELMRGIKRVFDPNGVMNPGKIFD
jgi:FAD/FMN-containing dehydrogenase